MDLYQRTEQRQDELFYRTFPEASPQPEYYGQYYYAPQDYPTSPITTSSLYPALQFYEQTLAMPMTPSLPSCVAQMPEQQQQQQQPPQQTQSQQQQQSQLVMQYPQVQHHIHTPRPKLQRQHAHAHTHTRSPSSEVSVSSPQWLDCPPLPSPRNPLPAKRQLDKKPPLACHFCRGRKIACGPPLPGSLDKTCNQCQRRNLECRYPTESRRGMRKKKTVDVVSTETVLDKTLDVSAS